MLKTYHTKNFRNILLIIIIIFILLLSFLFVKYHDNKKNSELSKCNINSSLESFTSFNQDFSLLHEDGFLVSREQLIDYPSLIYFGYTFCPDICPFDLMRNSQVVELLGTESIKIKPIFITLDPRRDTLLTLKEYTDFHHRDMIGLTGTVEDLKKIKDIFMIYSQFPSDLSGDYIINHSTFTYFVLPEIGLVTYFTRNNNVKEISDTIKCILNEYKIHK
tara:strand:- start:107 stop:763 length:657 start_codon:yes stop_codon:yes gene_type:complete